MNRAELVKAVELHLRADDPLFEGYAQNRATIISHPESAGPLVVQRLLAAEDSVQMGRAANLLIEMDYERKEVRDAIKQVLSRARRNLDGKPQARMLREGAQALERVGDPEDAEALLPLLEHRERTVRINAVRALGAIAGADAAEAIEQALKQHAQSLSVEALQEEMDSHRKEFSFLYEGFQSLARIKYRELLMNELQRKEDE